MVTLDIRTVIFSFVLVNIVSTLVVIFLWMQYRERYKGIGYLVYAFLFQMIAYILIIMRGSIPDWLSSDAGNIISVTGIFLGYLGLEKFTGRVVFKLPFYILYFVFVLAGLWVTYIDPVPGARLAVVSTAYLILFGQCAWLMIFGVSRGIVKLTMPTGFVFAGFCSLSFIKIINFIISGENAIDYFQSGSLEAIVMICYQMLIIVLVVSIAFMFNYNLLRDIRSEEEKFSMIFHTAPNAIVLTNYPEGKIIEVNEKFVLMSGFEPSEAKGKSPMELNLWASEKDRLDIRHQLETFGGVNRKETAFKRKSGDIYMVLLSAKIMRVGSGNMLVASIYDITETKKLQDQVRHERNLLRTLVDHLPDPVSIKDTEGRYLLNNQAHLQLLGEESQDDVYGKSAFDFFSEEDASVYSEDDNAVIKRGKMIIDKLEYARHLETGFPYWHLTSKIPIKDDSGTTVQMLTISHDITERKRSEDILKETDEFNRSLLMTIPFGMDVVDQDGTIMFMGEKFRKMFGNDAVGKKCWELYCDDNRRCDGCPLLAEIKTGTTSTIEVQGILGGKIFEINHTGMIYHGKKAILEIFHDITSRKKNEGELIKSKEKAEESDRLKTAFLHNISHEIRTPMNAIVGFANLLREPGISREEHDSYTEIISRSSNHLLSIVNDVIEISNVEAGRLRISLSEVSLAGILNDLFKQFMQEAMDKNLEFKLNPPEHAITNKINTDGTKLFQILSNLLNNAFKFTSIGSVSFGYIYKEPFIEFFVADTGIGIDSEVQSKIFERFYQVDNTVARQHEGTGIGLSISKAYVELLGGKIWVKAAPGKGSVFYFTIPHIFNGIHNQELQL